jgi:hypothetical protein
MALDKLPLELIQFIVQHLPEQGDRLALVLSCRRFHELFITTLYSNVTLFKSFDDCTWYSFVQTVARKPHLAEAVRSLYLHPWDVEDGAEDVECDPNLASELVEEIILDDDHNDGWEKEREEWEENAQSGIPDAWLGLILPRLTNLRRIDIFLPYGATYFHKTLRKAAVGDIPPFPNLEEAYISWYDTHNAVASPYLLPFLRFPSMRKLGGSKIAEFNPATFADDTDELVERPPTESSGITHLDFEDSNSTENGMIDLIGSCKALQSFRLGYGGAMVSGDDFYPRALVESLKKRHTKSLERLWVEVDCDGPVDGDDMLIGSLAEFTALNRLHIRLPDLLDFHQRGQAPRNALKDVLPPSLTILYLSWCERAQLQYLPQQLEDLIQSRRESESQLVKLDIQDEGDVPPTDPVIEQLRDICSAAGINFKFVCVKDMDWATRWEYRLSTWPRDFEFVIP